jgi:hypothetical protein
MESFRGYPVARALSSEGGEADILVIRDGGGREYVLRLYRAGREPAPAVMERLVALSARRDPTVVNTYEAGLDGETGRFYEIQEYLPEGDLEAWARGRRLDGGEFRELAAQLARAVSMLHREGIVHRDIKPDNILLRSRSPVSVALADFGVSSAYAPGAAARETRTAATPLYSPPESFAGFAGPAGDWWSLGAVLLECLTGAHPLAGLPLNMVMREISSRGLRVPEGLPPGTGTLLKGLLTRDDRRRWGGAEVEAWLAGRRDVPVHYEGDAALAAAGGEGGFARPFVFLEGVYRDPRGLAGAFAASPAAWGPALAALSRGLVRDWLEENRAYDEAVSMDDPEAGTPDLRLYSFILHFRPDLGHVYRGERLSPDLFAEILADPAPPPHREAIARDLEEGRLRGLPAAARRRGRPLQGILRALLETAPEGGGAAPALLAARGAAGPSRGHSREPLIEWPPRSEAGAPGAAPGAGTAEGAPPAPADWTGEGAAGAGGGAGRGGGRAAVPRELYAAALAAARERSAYLWGEGGPPPDEECVARILASGVPPLSWRWYEANIPARLPVPAEVFRGLAGEPPGYRRAAEALAEIADLARQAEGGLRFFFRRREAEIQGRTVHLSPLGLADYLRYFQFRLTVGSRSAPGFHHERIIREREEEAGASGINPFRGPWAWAGNWCPAAFAAFVASWAAVSREPVRQFRTMGKFGGMAGSFTVPGDAFFTWGTILNLCFLLAFWISALAASDRLFPRWAVYFRYGAGIGLLLLYLGFTSGYPKPFLAFVTLSSLLVYRHLLGLILRRRLLERGALPDD